MRAGGRASRRVCGVAAAALSLLASPSLEAGEAEELPTVERVQLDEQAGRVEEALAG